VSAEGAGTTAPFHVLHLRNSDLVGGPERLILDQAKRAPAGVTVSIASFGKEGFRHRFLEAARARGLATYLVPQKGSYDFRLVGRARTLLHALRPDVVVGHDYKADLVLRRAAQAEVIPWVAIVHGYTAENSKVRLFEALDRRAIRHAHAVVVVSEAGRQQVLASGTNPARVHLIENGVDVDAVRAAAQAGRVALRAEWGVGTEHVVLLALGRLSSEKGHRVLLDALRSLPAVEFPNLRVMLVGDGAERAALAAQAHDDPRLRFLGWRTDPHACLGAADLFVQPSLREGLPISLLEAMAVGLPIAATAVGGVPEALDHGDCGLLVPPGDSRALAAALRQLLAVPAEDQRHAGAAAQAARTRYGVERQSAALLDLYRSVGPVAG
jgi:glycosyltransferase involved in cell wall biosynthesis